MAEDDDSLFPRRFASVTYGPDTGAGRQTPLIQGAAAAQLRDPMAVQQTLMGQPPQSPAPQQQAPGNPNQLGGDMESRVRAVIDAVAQLHGGKPQQQAAPQAPQNAYAPSNPQPQGPSQQYGAPSTMGQRGELPPGFTMQRGEPTAEFPGGVTRYNGVFPPQGQQQAQQGPGDGAQANGQLAKLPQLGAPPPPATRQDALNYMAQHGIDTSSPGAMHYVPEVMKTLDDLNTKRYSSAMDLRTKAAQVDQHVAATQKAVADAELARKKALMTGNPGDITRAKALMATAQKYMDTHPEGAAKTGWLGSSFGAKDADPAYSQAQKDVEQSKSVLRGFSAPEAADGGEAGQPTTLGDNPDAEYEALPSGATFIGPDGKTRKKP